MTRDELYDYLESLLPSFQWVQTYLDDMPPPKAGKNWGTMNIIDVENVGWTQNKQIDYNPKTGNIILDNNLTRVYHIQFDYYGLNSFENALSHNQILMASLQNETRPDIGLKGEISDIRNLTKLLENKKYEHRHSFDLELFVVDTVTRSSPAIERAEIKIFNRGNGVVSK